MVIIALTKISIQSLYLYAIKICLRPIKNYNTKIMNFFNTKLLLIAIFFFSLQVSKVKFH